MRLPSCDRLQSTSGPPPHIPHRMFASTDRVELSALWDELVAGTCKIDSWSHEPDCWSLVVTRDPALIGSPAIPLRRRDQDILESALLCGVRKIVAVEVGLSCSSIAVIMQSCFQFMGLHCLPSRIPGLVVAAAHARYAHSPRFGVSLRGPRDRRLAQQSIRVPRPDTALAAWLAPAEHAVIALLIEGQSYAEIARARNTSIRTVANQVAAAFRRLGVSGRAELLCLLARWGLDAPQLPQRRPPSNAPATTRRSMDSVSSEHCLSPSLAT
jgi:DNA-binding CsgD family transcriptional regulator